MKLEGSTHSSIPVIILQRVCKSFLLPSLSPSLYALGHRYQGCEFNEDSFFIARWPWELQVLLGTHRKLTSVVKSYNEDDHTCYVITGGRKVLWLEPWKWRPCPSLRVEGRFNQSERSVKIFKEQQAEEGVWRSNRRLGQSLLKIPELQVEFNLDQGNSKGLRQKTTHHQYSARAVATAQSKARSRRTGAVSVHRKMLSTSWGSSASRPPEAMAEVTEPEKKFWEFKLGLEGVQPGDWCRQGWDPHPRWKSSMRNV